VKMHAPDAIAVRVICPQVISATHRAVIAV
jgi:hypothetical protein